MALEFRLDVLDANGLVVGSGPLASLPSWNYTSRMDRAGAVTFSVPATDAKALQLILKRRAQAYAYINGAWVDMGAGIIDHIDRAVAANGTVTLGISGDDLMRELSYRSVGFLEIGAGGVNNAWADTKAALAPLLPLGWTIDDSYVESVPQPTIYARFAGESVLAACIKLSAAHQVHFRRGTGRVLEFFSSAIPDIETWDIVGRTRVVDLHVVSDTYELLTRIYPYGAGVGRARLNLAATTRTAPPGYTLNLTSNYIENDTATAAYGVIERYVEYKDVSPIVNTSSDVIAAANMLFDFGLEELRQRSEEITESAYRLRLADMDALIRPGDLTHVAYRDVAANIDIDATLFVLESTISVDAKTLRTTDLLVSSVDRWPKGDNDVQAAEMAQGQVFQAHPQQNANSYRLSFSKNVDDDEQAEFRFRFDDEILQLVRVTFDFQILPMESTVRSVGGATTAIPSGGGATFPAGPPTPDGLSDTNFSAIDTATQGALSSNPTNHSHAMSGHQHDFDHAHNITVPDHDHTFTPNVSTVYGIFRETLARTFVLGELEYSLDGATWYAFTVGINRYTFLGNDWHRVDLTDLLWNPTTFRPAQPDNLLRIRDSRTAMVISSIQFTLGFTVTAVVNDVGALATGDYVTITGTTDYNGTWLVESVNAGADSFTFTGISGVLEAAGSVVRILKATIDAQLAVVGIIQAIDYEAV